MTSRLLARWRRLIPATAWLLAGFPAGCEPIPDLKVTVGQIPANATQLSVVVWSSMGNPMAGPMTPSKAPLNFKLPQSTMQQDYSFGLKLDDGGRNYSYIIAAASFDSKLCLQSSAMSAVAPDFATFTGVTMIMPAVMPSSGTSGATTTTSACYDKLDGTPAPRISGASVSIVPSQSTSASPPPSPMVQLNISGWGYQPKAQVKVQRNNIDLTVTMTEVMGPGAIQVGLANLIDQNVMNMTPPLGAVTSTITVTNPDGQSTTAKFNL